MTRDTPPVDYITQGPHGAAPAPHRTLPLWLSRTLHIGLWAMVVLGLLLSFAAWTAGILPNFYFVMLMGASVVLGLSRLIRLFTGGIVWKDLTGARGISPFIHIGARVAFWAAVTALSFKAVVPVQFSDTDWAELKIIFAVCGGVTIVLSLLPKASRRRPMTVFALLSLIFMCSAFFRVVGYETPKNAVLIGSPFAGEAYVFQGGPTALLSHHYPYKNQRHALDLVVLNSDGKVFSDIPIAQDPCFGQSLLSPISGQVVAAVNAFEDEPTRKQSDDHLAGNRVVIRAKDGAYFILLAHLQKDSLTVSEGERVTRGQVVGACGNSGNSSGPHLHMQAQTVADFDDPDIRTLPMAFDGISRLRGGTQQSGRAFTLRRNDRMTPTP